MGKLKSDHHPPKVEHVKCKKNVKGRKWQFLILRGCKKYLTGLRVDEKASDKLPESYLSICYEASTHLIFVATSACEKFIWLE